MMSEAQFKIDNNPDQTLPSSGNEEAIQIQSKETGQVTRDDDKNDLLSRLYLWRESSFTVTEEETNGLALRGLPIAKDEHGCDKAVPEKNSSLSAKRPKSLTAVVELAQKSPETDLQSAVLSDSPSKDGDAKFNTDKTKMSASNTRCQKETEKRNHPEKLDSSNEPEERVETKKNCKQCMYEVCSNNFTSAVTLDRYINTSCNNNVLNKIKHNVCKKECTCTKDLKARTKMHSAIKEKPSPRCEGCHKDFTVIPDLFSNDHSLKCNFCNKTFTQKGHLTMHKKVHVGTQTVHSCDQCDQTFMQRSHLLIHLRIHTGENPFTCPVCDRAFKQRGNLTVHMSQHDLNQPRFTCNICGKQFYQRSHYNIHVRIHNGDYPFTCQVCGKGFKQRGNLNVHLRTHRPESEEKELKKEKKNNLGKVSSDGVKLQRTSLTDANIPSIDQYSYNNNSLDNSSMSNENIFLKAETSSWQVPDIFVMKPENMEVDAADTKINSDSRTVCIIPIQCQSPIDQNVVEKCLIDDCCVEDIGSVSTSNDMSSIHSTENAQDTNLRNGAQKSGYHHI